MEKCSRISRRLLDILDAQWPSRMSFGTSRRLLKDLDFREVEIEFLEFPEGLFRLSRRSVLGLREGGRAYRQVCGSREGHVMVALVTWAWSVDTPFVKEVCLFVVLVGLSLLDVRSGFPGVFSSFETRPVDFVD